MSSWKSLRYRIEEAGCLLLKNGIPRLSRRRCVKLANLLGEVTFRADERGRSVALANLECALGDRYSAADRRDIALASYRNFARTMLDLFWSRHLLEPGGQRWIVTEGFEPLRDRMLREKCGSIFLCVHQGNWEWASIAGGFVGLHNAVVTEPFKNPRLTAIFSSLREASGQTMIPQENSLVRMLKIVKRGGTTGMLIDLNLRPTQAATVIDGFGLKMCVPLLHTVLAQRTNALLIPVETFPQPDGSCQIRVHQPPVFSEGATMQQIAQECWNVFEPGLRERPDLWLWTYKHFRYRPKNAPERYPFYANESSQFETLLREVARQS